MTYGQFGMAMTKIAQDGGALTRISKADLAIMHAVLSIVVDRMNAEMERRDLKLTLIQGGKT